MRYTLKLLTALALENNRSLQAAADQAEAARANIVSARAFPNPELGIAHGTLKARLPGAAEGDSRGIWVSQRIDYSWVRSARIEAADAGFDAAGAEQKLSLNELLARLRFRFYELLRQEAELKAALEDETTIEQIAYRIKLKVETGESPRFEAIKVRRPFGPVQPLAGLAQWAGCLVWPSSRTPSSRNRSWQFLYVVVT